MKKTKNSMAGITLIALVITIIVLLILAGVTIAMLTGENGILSRAQESSIQSRIGEGKEKSTLIATEAFQEYYNEAYVENTRTYSEADLNSAVVSAINTKGPGQMPNEITVVGTAASGSEAAKVQLFYAKPGTSEAQASITGTITSGRINWGAIRYDAKEAQEAREQAERETAARAAFISTVRSAVSGEAEEGKITPEALKSAITSYFTAESMTALESLDLTDGIVQTGTSLTATSGGYTVTLSEVLKGITVANANNIVNGVGYGSKTPTTISKGEDLTITIGNTTESFRVLSTDNSTTIVAVPFYNITLDTTNPVQTDADYGNITSFSKENYWTKGTNTIDMTDSRNYIQKYITAYSKKLSLATGGTETDEGVTGGKVTARVARYSEMSASGVTSTICNPGRKRDFWLGSGASVYTSNVVTVRDNRCDRLLRRVLLWQQQRCSSCNNYRHIINQKEVVGRMKILSIFLLKLRLCAIIIIS